MREIKFRGDVIFSLRKDLKTFIGFLDERQIYIQSNGEKVIIPTSDINLLIKGLQRVKEYLKEVKNGI